MKTIEFYLNAVHFCYYKVHYKSYLLYKKISPSQLLFKIPAIKRKAEKEGVDLYKSVDTAFGDKTFGLSTTVAGGFLFTLLFFLFFDVFGVVRKFFTTESLETIHFVIFGVFSVVVCYIFVFKKDKYIPYFDKFEKWTIEEKRKYFWLTLTITIAVFCLWILSF